MIRSMTGYGDAERNTGEVRLRLEIRTVNHRYFNANLRTPFGFDRHHADIERWLKGTISRGHVNYSLSLERSAPEAEVGVELDLERARAYRNLLRDMQGALELPGEVDVSTMSRFKDLFRATDPAATPAVESGVLEELTAEAAAKVVEMRQAEGERLEVDLRGRLAAISDHLDTVAARAPERLVQERERLRDAIRSLLDGIDVDEERIAREIAHLAERWDVNEELVRFRSHVELFGETMERDAEEPSGKRLGFIVQEMLREANTIGSKANDTAIAHATVAIKEEIERLREQVENVE